MKSLLAIWAIVVITGLGTFAYIDKAMADSIITDCPEGSYQIGWDKNDERTPLCKLQPTGCPYGDSIPLDSPKCAPGSADVPPAPAERAIEPSYSAPAENDADPFAGGK